MSEPMTDKQAAECMKPKHANRPTVQAVVRRWILRDWCFKCGNTGWFQYDGKPHRCTCKLGASNAEVSR